MRQNLDKVLRQSDPVDPFIFWIIDSIHAAQVEASQYQVSLPAGDRRERFGDIKFLVGQRIVCSSEVVIVYFDEFYLAVSGSPEQQRGAPETEVEVLTSSWGRRASGARAGAARGARGARGPGATGRGPAAGSLPHRQL